MRPLHLPLALVLRPHMKRSYCSARNVVLGAYCMMGMLHEGDHMGWSNANRLETWHAY